MDTSKWATAALFLFITEASESWNWSHDMVCLPPVVPVTCVSCVADRDVSDV